MPSKAELDRAFVEQLDARIAAKKAKLKKPAAVRESKVEEAHVASVKRVGGTSYKFTSPGRRAVPDRLDLLPISNPAHRDIVAQYITFTECKKPGEVPTPAQAREHGKLRDLGFRVDVVDFVKKDLFT